MCGAVDFGVDHGADYRALTINGEYIWIRDVVHGAKPDGKSIVCLDLCSIFRSVKTKNKIRNTEKTTGRYSYQDGLTRITNRRFFEDSYQREWLNAQREQQPLTLMLLGCRLF